MAGAHNEQRFLKHPDTQSARRGYEDILYLPHHQSATHTPMTRHNRAAQFAPFAALNGYEEAIREEARLTEARQGLSDMELRDLSDKLHRLRHFFLQHPRNRPLPVLSVTFFEPDDRKEGGACLTVTGPVKRIDEYGRCIVMANGRQIPFENIQDISGVPCTKLTPD